MLPDKQTMWNKYQRVRVIWFLASHADGFSSAGIPVWHKQGQCGGIGYQLVLVFNERPGIDHIRFFIQFCCCCCCSSLLGTFCETVSWNLIASVDETLLDHSKKLQEVWSVIGEAGFHPAPPWFWAWTSEVSGHPWLGEMRSVEGGFVWKLNQAPEARITNRPTSH